ncbi:MAG: Fe-S cluster assembly scaffold protein NifU [Candidatus Aminicenantes bacterium]|nr:Fe-S cluster assembly scaffold protein NifU [Candidatus Aminicenantes bacterium]NIM81996.1 Fe-S cluster assembly scaffold protein NifU [Candidatus Aminicenantes bacterium]NIN21384.1 Fe-S cluster assembly scaffold protein NifU [Candidatus Aminicenantes bacterium]NIN45205.1 Fe-S cluster assembly scaffold protein NifU [Candidatus Aminicenantes bacterium]NIN88022.1 Fe-S cluster assembly scaffold protein NifU [Candidatus Aminicenantes bacterium]
MYSQKVMEMFRDTKNYGKIEDADGIGKVGNPKCGDVMWIYIKVENEKIADAKFETFGCVAAIATSTMAIDMIKGKPVEEALRLTNKAVAEALDGLPPEKMHCSLLAEEGVKSAIEDYLSRKKNAA